MINFHKKRKTWRKKVDRIITLTEFAKNKFIQANFPKNKIKSTDWRGNQEIGWFISDLVLTIGMIGTVSGFLLMLTGAFAGVDLNDEVAMKNVLEQMSKGMSTALYTTLFGLICGSLLKIQYFSLGRATDILIGQIDTNLNKAIINA